MCGIVGAVAQREVWPILVEGLKRLEYRGYDSAGLALLDAGQLNAFRVKGKVAALEKSLLQEKPKGAAGIAHTRWATHGAPSETNAHPMLSNNELALIHNGIIENHEALKGLLIEAGYTFSSQTDTEVIVHLIHQKVAQGASLIQAVHATMPQLKGSFAIAVIDKKEPDCIVIARRNSPLVIGLGVGENFVASDALALLPVTTRFVYLEDGESAVVKKDTYVIYDKHHEPVERAFVESELTLEQTTKGQYKHYMLKEIMEQADAVIDTLEDRLVPHNLVESILGATAAAMWPSFKRVEIVACGTSYHAGLVAQYWIESIARMPCRVDVASEERYRDRDFEPHTLFVVISQSGETADTLAALKASKAMASLAIVNVDGSAMMREADFVLNTLAGPEIGVASTKAFTAQLAALLLLTMMLAEPNAKADTLARGLAQLRQLPLRIQDVLSANCVTESMVDKMSASQHALFIGRGALYPIAKEGALKLKEISYIHAEGYAAGELKHGPLALVDKHMPVVVLAPSGSHFEKINSNIEEVASRGGQLIILTDEAAAPHIRHASEMCILPTVDEWIQPILLTLPLQLLAYQVAIRRGTDVDQPRNLAKSVTVE